MLFAEYVDGIPLNKLSGRWHMRLYDGEHDDIVQLMVSIAVQLATGLQFLHTRGILHQDIKPANIMLTHDNVVKIIDFGLARQGRVFIEDNFPTVAAQLSGSTRAYQSPEVRNSDISDLIVVLNVLILVKCMESLFCSNM